MSIASAAELVKTARVLVYAYRDPETPLLPKLLLFITLAYALSPVDLVPDFIPVLGHLDDLVVVPLLAAISYRLIPARVLARARKRAETSAGEPRGGMRFAAVVVITWIVLCALTACVVLIVRG